MSLTPSASNDRVLISLAIGGVVLSVGTAIVGALGIAPTGTAAIVVIAAMSLALRLALGLRTRRSSALSNPRVMNLVSLVSLGLAALAALSTIAVALPGGEPALFAVDLFVNAWGLAVLMVASAPVRTVGWRSIVGISLAGFLASSALSRLVGAPVVAALGVDDIAATSIWVPVTEELFKALPVAAIALMFLRSRSSRPSVADIGLLGAFAGAGFTVMENLQFGRVWAGWTAAPPMSFLFPSMEAAGRGAGPWDAVAGHLIWTALFCLGIGFGVLYLRRLRFAWIAIPATFVLIVIEHGVGNALLPVPVGGVLSSMVVIAGFAGSIWYEGRAVRGRSRFRDGIVLRPAAVEIRRGAFARLQVPAVAALQTEVAA
ncbi:hypothetical protein BH11ACT3_BH11ACT3_07570 [soil metagenome]